MLVAAFVSLPDGSKNSAIPRTGCAPSWLMQLGAFSGLFIPPSAARRIDSLVALGKAAAVIARASGAATSLKISSWVAEQETGGGAFASTPFSLAASSQKAFEATRRTRRVVVTIAELRMRHLTPELRRTAARNGGVLHASTQAEPRSGLGLNELLGL